jgi:hypothetical protein
MRCARTASACIAASSASTSAVTPESGERDDAIAAAIASRAAFAALIRPPISRLNCAGSARALAERRRARARSPTFSASRSSKNVIAASTSQHATATSASHAAPSSTAATSTPAATRPGTGWISAFSASARRRSRRLTGGCGIRAQKNELILR